MLKPINKNNNNYIIEDRYPHAPDVLERDTAENGFASGWAMHQKPVPKYFFDCHLHYSGKKDSTMNDIINSSYEIWKAKEVERIMMIFNIYGSKRDCFKPEYTNPEWYPWNFPWLTIEDLQDFFPDLSNKNNYFWSAWIDHREPNPELIHSVADAGTNCIKLHNAPVIETNAPYDLWLTDEWKKVFKAIDERGLSVLFHVTQRLPSSVYSGGERNVYWTKGWEAGVTYGNEDLLQAFLTCCETFPNIPFIGAHQLHIGWDRLDELFTKYPNLYVDTTIGCLLRLYDNFYDFDKEYLRQIFIKWADKIIFGTDTFWGENDKKPDVDFLEQHKRFILLLDLPDSALNKICHGNIERLFGLEALL